MRDSHKGNPEISLLAANMARGLGLARLGKGGDQRQGGNPGHGPRPGLLCQSCLASPASGLWTIISSAIWLDGILAQQLLTDAGSRDGLALYRAN